MPARRPSSLPESGSPSTPDWRSLRRLWPYLREFPLRVGIALSLLVAAKLAGVSLPMVMKHLVDALDTQGDAVVAIPLLLLFFYGV
ncbi:MAG: metal ABC transporter permease, partial [Pseudomonadota bacterium]|nr:metal ABC transporter permease [Pseudomonadota bacterium]